MRTCSRCGSDGPFYENANPICRECQRTQTREWQSRNPDRVRQHRLKRFGLTLAAYEALLTDQGGVCAICSASPAPGRALAVDHQHDARGAVRGLLCDRCNLGIAHFAEAPERLEAAVGYLKDPPAARVLAAVPGWAKFTSSGAQLGLLEVAA